MSDPIVEIESMKFTYPPVLGVPHTEWTLSVPDLCIRPATAYSLRGENMAGKSTFVRILAGIAPRATGGKINGVIRYAGEEIRTPSSPYRMANMGVATVHQSDPLFPHLSIRDNLRLGRAVGAIGLRWRGRTGGGSNGISEEIVKSLAGDLDRPVATLSGGGRAVVRLVRAFQRRFDLLLMDEPLAHLDPRRKEEGFWCLEELLSARGAEGEVPSLILISHETADHEACKEVATRCGLRYQQLLVEGGKVKMQKPT